jgi:hypothetical protein
LRQPLFDILVVLSVKIRVHPWLITACLTDAVVLRCCSMPSPTLGPSTLQRHRSSSISSELADDPPIYSPRSIRSNQKPRNRLHEDPSNYSPALQDLASSGEQFAVPEEAVIVASRWSAIVC